MTGDSSEIDGLIVLADLLAGARDLRGKIAGWPASPTSTASHDLQQCQEIFGTPRPVLRTVACVDLWTIVAADQLYAVSLLLRDGTTGFGIFPLLRSVVEHSTLAVWVLDERASLPVRGARSAACALRSALGEAMSNSHMFGRDSDEFRKAKAQLNQIREQTRLEEASLAATSVQLTYGNPPTPTDVVRDYGQRLGSSDAWEGMYDFLCSMATHPNLDALGLADIDTGGTSVGFTLPARLIRSVLSHAVKPYLDALSRLAEYMGWDWRESVQEYSGLIDSTLAGNPDQESASTSL